MAYLHGVRVQENPTSVASPVSNESGVPVIFGTAPINMAAEPDNATNKLFLCKTFAEAKAAVGYSEDYEKYTLCQAMDAFFKAFGVGPIVLCNVLNPATHKAAYTETLAVTNGQAVSQTEGVLLSGLTAKADTTDLVLNTDYTVEFNESGYLVLTIIKEGVASVSLTGNKLDASTVTAEDIIGSYDVSTGEETGTELVRKVYPQFGVAPGLLLAPGWSQNPSVGLALAEKCKDINGMFKCECVVDIDCSSTGATKYTDVENVKSESGFINEHMIALWPKVKYAGKTMAYSAIYAAMVAYTDYNNDNVPSLPPSNHAIRVSAAVLADGTEVILDIPQANELNAVGVVTAINMNGFKAWGNNTAAYPETTDPKDRWINCRRFFSWWGNSFIMNYLVKVDNPANYRLIESIVDSENVRGNSLVSQGKCAGIKMVYDKADNPVQNVLDGKIVFRQYLAPYTPAEDILNVLEFDPSMIEAALGGE
jgi:phage tail sheath protein FI